MEIKRTEWEDIIMGKITEDTGSNWYRKMGCFISNRMLYLKRNILFIVMFSSFLLCACQKEEKEVKQKDNEYGYTLQECVYEGQNHKGNWDICYPELESEELDVEKCNVFISEQIEKVLSQIDEEAEMNVYLRYSVKKRTDKVISMVLAGSYTGKNAAHPMNLSFCVNYDLENQKEILIEDVFSDKSSVLKRCREAIEEQCEQYLIDTFFEISDKDFEKQIFEEENNFYFEDNKIYLRMTVPASSPYYEYVSIDI